MEQAHYLKNLVDRLPAACEAGPMKTKIKQVEKVPLRLLAGALDVEEHTYCGDRKTEDEKD